MKRVVITGGASGLGLAMARYYASQGWAVCIADVQTEIGEKIISEFKEKYVTPCFFSYLDVTQGELWLDLCKKVKTRWNGVDVLINNAGVASSGNLDEVALDDFKWTLDINLMGVVNGSHYFIPLLKQSKGHLINIASMAGLLHMAGMSAYNASKAAVVALSETLYCELDPFDVKVSVLCPAFFKTNLTENMRSAKQTGTDMAGNLMEKSSINSDDIAKKVYVESAKGQFMILTHKREKFVWRLKRLLPSLYLKIIKGATSRFEKELERSQLSS